MRILCTGSRDWTDIKIVDWMLQLARLRYQMGEFDQEPITVVEGGADGLDQIAWQVANDYGWRHETHKPDYEHFGRAAPILRDKLMVQLGADICLAFINPCIKRGCEVKGIHGSHGATGTAAMAEFAGIETIRITRLGQ